MSDADVALIIETDPPVAFFRGARPADVDITHRRLVGYSGTRDVLRYETGAPNASGSVTLDNGDGGISSVLGDGALFAPATLRRNGIGIWSGIVSRLSAGPAPAIGLEAGGGLSYTDDFPLRLSDVWDAPDAVVPIPHVYGRVTIGATVAYPYGANQYVLADHALLGIDWVTVDGLEVGEYRLVNTTDPTGHAVALLDLGSTVTQAPGVRVRVRGKGDPDTGALIDQPDRLFVDLHRVAGLTLDDTRLDDLRVYTRTAGLTVAGVVDQAGVSIQSTLDAIFGACGIAWGPAAEGLAMVWPPLSGTPVANLTPRMMSPDLSAQADRRDIVTRLVVDWGRDWTTGEPMGSFTLVAPDAVERFGDRTTTTRLSWVTSEAQAQAIAERALAYWSRAVWTVQVEAKPGNYAPGQRIGIYHPHSPIVEGVVVDVFRTESGDTLTIQAPGGEAVSVERV